MADGNAINVGQFDADALPMQYECPCRCTLCMCGCLWLWLCLCGVSEIYSQQFFAYFSIVFNWHRAEFTTVHREEHMQRLLRTDRRTEGRTDRGRQLSGAAAATKYLAVSLSLSSRLHLPCCCCLPF